MEASNGSTPRAATAQAGAGRKHPTLGHGSGTPCNPQLTLGCAGGNGLFLCQLFSSLNRQGNCSRSCLGFEELGMSSVDAFHCLPIVVQEHAAERERIAEEQARQGHGAGSGRRHGTTGGSRARLGHAHLHRGPRDFLGKQLQRPVRFLYHAKLHSWFCLLSITAGKNTLSKRACPGKRVLPTMPQNLLVAPAA